MRAGVVALVAVCACHQVQRPTWVRGVPLVEDVQNDAIGTFFDCDAAAGVMAEWSQPVGSVGRAQGALFIAKVQHGSDSVPSAGVVLFSHARQGRVGLTIKLDNRWRSLEPTVRYAANGASNDELSQRLKPRNIRGMSFEMEWNGQHARLRLEPNAPWLELDLAFVPERFALQCSTGETVFHAVSVTSETAQ